MPVVSVTRARVRLWRYRPVFLLHSFRIGWYARRARGNLAVKMLWDRRGTYWTCTCWESAASMQAFVRTRPHAPMLLKLPRWCDEAAFIHWVQAGIELPSWDEAHRRLEEAGRPAAVNHPSEAHLRRAIAAPVVRPFHHLEIR